MSKCIMSCQKGQKPVRNQLFPKKAGSNRILPFLTSFCIYVYIYIYIIDTHMTYMDAKCAQNW